MSDLRRDLDFNLFELLPTYDLLTRARFKEHDRGTITAMLDAAERIASEKLAPCYQLSDEQEPGLVDGQVRVPAEVADAIRSVAEAGFIAASHDAGIGGMQAPVVAALASQSLLKAANISVDAYATLTSAAARVLDSFGSGPLKARYRPALLEGRWLGTMALTEPEAGSSLADIATRAEPRGDGTYLISGSKIFISGGDHDVTDNIVHLVLARIAGAPAGTRGLSLFVVPKRRPDDSGQLIANDVHVAGIIHKMGFRGTTSTILRFGEQGDCIGELLGEPNHGLPHMFQMMNEARIHVGLGATMLGYAGYGCSVRYARERRQGRAVDVGTPAGPQRHIIEHADVKRMLMSQKAAVEGALSLCLYGAWLVDESTSAPDAGARSRALGLLDLLTPVIKSWPSRWCLDSNSTAIQVLGGYGYTRDFPVEQMYRDNRLNAIHEGTEGIQALDFVGRKILRDRGAVFEQLCEEVAATIEEARASLDDRLVRQAIEVESAWRELRETTTRIVSASDTHRSFTLANATTYLELAGHAIVAWIWLKSSALACSMLGRRPEGLGRDFYEGKVRAAGYFIGWELPRVAGHHVHLRSFDPLFLDLPESCF